MWVRWPQIASAAAVCVIDRRDIHTQILREPAVLVSPSWILGPTKTGADREADYHDHFVLGLVLPGSLSRVESRPAVLGMRSTELRLRSCLLASRTAACMPRRRPRTAATGPTSVSTATIIARAAPGGSTVSLSCVALADAGITSRRVLLCSRVDGSASRSRSGRTCICHARSRSQPDYAPD